MNNIYYRTFEKLEEDIFVPTPDNGNGTGEKEVDIRDLKTATEGFDVYKNSQSENKDAEALVKIYKSFQDGRMDGDQTDFLVEKNSQYWNNYNKFKGNYKYSNQVLALRKSCPNLIRNNLNMSASEKGAKYVATRLAELQYFGLDGKKINPDTITGRNDKNLLFATYIFQRCCSTYADKARQTYKKVKNDDYMVDGIIGPAGMLSLADNKNVCLFDEKQMNRIKPYYTNESVNLVNLRSDVESKTIKREANEINEKTYKQISLSDEGKTVKLEINSKAPFEAKDANRFTASGYIKDPANGNKFTKIIALEGTYTINYNANASTEATAWKLDFTAAEKKDNVPETVDLTSELADIDKSVATIFDPDKISKDVTITLEGNGKKADFTYENIHYTILYNTSDKSYVLESGSEILSKTGNDYTLGQTTIANTKNMDVKSKDKVINIRIMLGDLAKTFTAIEPETPKYTIEDYNREFIALESGWKVALSDINRTTLSSTQPDQVAKQDSKVIEGTKLTIKQAISKLSPFRDTALALKSKYAQFKSNKDAKNADTLREVMDTNIKFLEKLPGLIDDKAKLETLVKQYNELISEGNTALGLYKDDNVKYIGKLNEAEGKYKEAQKIENQAGKTGVESKLQEIATIKLNLLRERANTLQIYNNSYTKIELGYKAEQFNIVSALPTEVNAASLKSLEIAMQAVSDYEAHIAKYELEIIGLQKSYDALSDKAGASNPLVLTGMINGDKEAVARRKQAIIEGRDKINKEVYKELKSNLNFGGTRASTNINGSNNIFISDLVSEDRDGILRINQVIQGFGIKLNGITQYNKELPAFGTIKIEIDNKEKTINLTHNEGNNVLTITQ